MQKVTEEALLDVLKDIRNWMRAAAHAPVLALLKSQLPDAKARMAYQMLDGSASMEQVRVACKMSPNALLELANRWSAAGLMEINQEKKRVRLFDLEDFGLLESSGQQKKASK